MKIRNYDKNKKKEKKNAILKNKKTRFITFCLYFTIGKHFCIQ